MTTASVREALLALLDDAEEEAAQAVFRQLRDRTGTVDRDQLLHRLDAMAEACRCLRKAVQEAERF